MRLVRRAPQHPLRREDSASRVQALARGHLVVRESLARRRRTRLARLLLLRVRYIIIGELNT
jgi:hypothetical protein